jgi:uncharacterized protein
MEINQSESGSKGKFQALENGTQIGLMTYSIAGEDKIIIDHTEVIPAYNGKGIGKKLVVKAVEFARKNNIKILPLCPFARGVFARNKDLRDVLV